MNDKPQICPMTLSEARVFVDQHHRHHQAPPGGLFAVGLELGSEVVGVATIGRPVARHSQDGYTAEVNRCCVLPGIKNGCSMLYGAAWRAARALGYRKLITYTLKSESGISMKAAGWTCIGEAGGGSWNCKARPRVDKHPTQVKLRWERAWAERGERR